MCEMTRVLISVSKLLVRGRSFPECCFHGFGNDTLSVGHVGGLCPARVHRLKILVGDHTPLEHLVVITFLKECGAPSTLFHVLKTKSRRNGLRKMGRSLIP